jgi:hypothetical protein
MSMTTRSSMVVCALLVVTLLVGCGEPRPEFVPAEGIVKINGKPDRGLTICLTPDEANLFQSNSTGTSDEQGKFKLKYEFKGEEGDGAAVGTYKIIVFDTKVGFTPQGQKPKPSNVPHLYGNPTTTPLSVEIKPGGPPIELDIRK